MISMNAIGRLGKDAEVKDVNGKKVIQFSVATDQGYGDKKTTLWIDVSKWGEQTGVATYLKKGTQVYVSGEPSLFTSDQGKTYLKLRADKIELLGSREAAAAPAEHPLGNVAPVAATDDLPF